MKNLDSIRVDTKAGVQQLISLRERDDILESYTRSDLFDMHVVVYGFGCPTGWRKTDILRSIEKYFAGIERAQHLKP